MINPSHNNKQHIFVTELTFLTSIYIQYVFTAVTLCVHVDIILTVLTKVSNMIRFTKKFPEKFWKFGNLPRDILGILGGTYLTNSFLRLYGCVYNTFVINSSGRSPRNFGGSTLFVKKFRNFVKFWKFLEIFGKF